MNIKRNIIFALESRKKDGVPITQNVPIRMRVIFASQRIEFTTGYRIDIEKWDVNKHRGGSRWSLYLQLVRRFLKKTSSKNFQKTS